MTGAVKQVGPKGARTIAALKGAARAEFTRVGYLNATVPGIAKQAGKSPAAFYKYFDSKRGLLEVLLQDFLREFNVLSEQPRDADLSRFEDMRAAVAAFWRAYRTHRVEWVSAQQAAAVDDEFLALWLRIRTAGVRAIARVVAAAQRAGSLPEGLDPDVTASHLSAMLEHSCYLWIGLDADAPGRPADDEQAITAMATLWHRAIWSGPAHAQPGNPPA